MHKVYLSRQQSKAAALDYPIGDPTGGAAFGEFNDPMTAVIAASSVANGIMGADAASSAADAQAASAAQSDATQRYIFDTQRADAAPYRAAGTNALADIVAGLKPGGQFNRNFTQNDLNSDLVYQNGLQFGLDEGIKGVNRQAAATGNLLSGATLKALTRYGNDYATTKTGDAYNRWKNNADTQFNRNASVAGLGQTANSQVAQAAQNFGNNVSATAQGLGNARAASAIGQSNAWTGAINGGMGAYQGSQLLAAMQRNGGYGGGASSIYNGGYNFDSGNMISGLGRG
jgi:hypothetical protein